jgi:hypothetical protein
MVDTFGDAAKREETPWQDGADLKSGAGRKAKTLRRGQAA